MPDRDKHLFYVVNVLLESLVYAHKILDRGTGMQHRGVILPAYFGTDGRKRAVQKIAAHVHGYLSRLDYLALPRL